MKKLLNVLENILCGLFILASLTLLILGALKKSILMLFVCAIIQVILIIVAVLHIRHARLERNKYKKKYNYYKSEFTRLQLELSSLKQKKNDSSRDSVDDHQKQQDTKPDNPSEEDTSIEATPQSEKNGIASQPIQEFFYEYYSSPNANGAFDRGYAKPSLADDSFYKVSGKPGDTHAKVELLKKKDYKRLFDFKSDCLYPVCEIAKNRQDGTSIVMVEAGCVNLQENKWFIDNKKKIIINIE